MASNSDATSEKSAQEMPQVQPADNPSPSTQGTTPMPVINDCPRDFPPAQRYIEQAERLHSAKRLNESDIRIPHGDKVILATRAKLSEASPVLKIELEHFSMNDDSNAFRFIQYPHLAADCFVEWILKPDTTYLVPSIWQPTGPITTNDYPSAALSHLLKMFELGRFYNLPDLLLKASDEYCNHVSMFESSEHLPSLSGLLQEIDGFDWPESSTSQSVLFGTLDEIRRIKKKESENISNAEAIEECLPIDASEKLRAGVQKFLVAKENEVESDTTSYGSDSDSEPSQNVDDGEPVNPSSEAELPQK